MIRNENRTYSQIKNIFTINFINRICYSFQIIYFDLDFCEDINDNFSDALIELSKEL